MITFEKPKQAWLDPSALERNPMTLGTSDIDGKAASIQWVGQRAPILVRVLPNGKRRIVYGNDRADACQKLGLKVWATEEEMTDERETIYRLSENIVRRELNDPVSVGNALVSLWETGHYPNLNELAAVFGKTTRHFTECIDIARNLDPSLRPFIGNKISVGEAWRLSQKPRMEQRMVFEGMERLRALNEGKRQARGMACECPKCHTMHYDRRSE